MSSYSCMPSLMAAIEYLPKNQKIMEKERKITAPEWCEIERRRIEDNKSRVRRLFERIFKKGGEK